MAAAIAPGLARPASAQEPQREIIVIAPRTVFGVEPERTLTPDDISAYGLSSIGELLNEVEAENGDTPDEPVFIVNGQRVASLSDVDDLPAEAIESVDVLPAGSGARVGASATRRVYSITLKKRLDTVAVRSAVRAATEGDWLTERGELSYTRLRGARRINLTGRVRHEDELLESDRGVVQPPSAAPGAGDYRTLRPEVQQYDLAFRAADSLAPWLRASVASKYTHAQRDSLLGPFDADGTAPPTARNRRNNTSTFDNELSLEADAGQWLFNLFGTYRVDHEATKTQRPDSAGLGLAEALTRATTRNTNLLLTATGDLFALPAGGLQLTLGGSLTRDSLTGTHDFLGDVGRNAYAQTSTGGSAQVTVPIASREHGFLGFLGDLTGTAEYSLTHVSNFGTLSNQTYSLVWQPAARLRIQGSISNGRTPPAVVSLARPLLETPGIRYFDPLRMETVEVTEISGGTAGLTPQRGISRLLSATYKVPMRTGSLQLKGEYRKIENRDIVTTLPQASAAVLAAFPDRFIRDSNGVLIAVDARPVVFARQSREHLRFGANLMVPLGRGSAGAQAGETDERDEASDRDHGASPRLQLNVSYTRLLSSQIVLLAGQDPVNLLSRDAVAFGGITPPRDQLDFTAGYAERGLGLRLSGQLRGASYLSVADGTTTDVLRFSPFAIFTARGFIEGSRLFGDSPWAKGSRLSLIVANITNSRQRVRDSGGVTPVAYQRAYRDPIGRTIELELRKVF